MPHARGAHTVGCMNSPAALPLRTKFLAVLASAGCVAAVAATAAQPASAATAPSHGSHAQTNGIIGVLIGLESQPAPAPQHLMEEEGLFY
jgi:hypothetical protein